MSNNVKKIFKALDINSALNTENKKVYETFDNDGVSYFLVDSKNKDYPRLDDYIKRATSSLKKADVEVDVKSFIEVFGLNTNEEIEDLITVLVVAFRFNQKAPLVWKLKLKKDTL